MTQIISKNDNISCLFRDNYLGSIEQAKPYRTHPKKNDCFICCSCEGECYDFEEDLDDISYNPSEHEYLDEFPLVYKFCDNCMSPVCVNCTDAISRCHKCDKWLCEYCDECHVN